MSEDLIADACARLGLPDAGEISHKSLILKDFLRFHGRAANLTSKLDDASLDQHIQEALLLVALARRLEVSGRWLDIGSGGGFPGLVLAIGLPDVELTLVEPRAKRATVLELGLRKLGRPDCRVLRGRIDAGRWTPLERQVLDPPFEAASARAVFDPPTWVREATPWLGPDGLVFLHLPASAANPDGFIEQARIEHDKWAIVAGRSSPR
ncbi:MAG: class I SAM-dependent methyltransferase [Myxococcales bacterium]|nr:class I SAM-dependent methyltransferase [Myxococcales bacterium]